MKFTIAILFALMAIASAKICVTVYTDTECSEGAQKQCIDSNKCESSGGYSAKYTCSGDEYTQLTYSNTDCSGEPSGNTTSTANDEAELHSVEHRSTGRGMNHGNQISQGQARLMRGSTIGLLDDVMAARGVERRLCLDAVMSLQYHHVFLASLPPTPPYSLMPLSACVSLKLSLLTAFLSLRLLSLSLSFRVSTAIMMSKVLMGLVLLGFVAMASGKACATFYTDSDCTSKTGSTECYATNKCLSESSGPYTVNVMVTCTNSTGKMEIYTTGSCSGTPASTTTYVVNQCVSADDDDFDGDDDLSGAYAMYTCASVATTAAAGVAVMGVLAALLF
ncbi:uncharacterized protein MONBRDRAFT_34145 [Monosiga brevicollis MX1]|uniref:SUEL-type lectin domain-containing protein n=1 Tax=Monosiga brevicollis TaxID=81824 RepID=A9V9U3_MONBE|nr:uncharacterized protein MONBRDRAFT_34145 [Monosiga brevicollis MX1]EDQ85726.1 predicted protein [Monosiga brevicollis MX1]|eukprot:XP_001749441.1 hypothetical protein [Monosiga brevicollis MX1]